VPGHREGDLILGCKASGSAVGTIVERRTGHLTVLPLPGRHDAASVSDAVIEQFSVLPVWFARTLTWDRGTEMAQHKRSTAAGFQVYFADPYAPWQRGSNQNTNGLLREYLPKGTDLRAWTPPSSRRSPPNSTTWLGRLRLGCSRGTSTAVRGSPRVRRHLAVLVSPPRRTDRHTAMLAASRST
jgi:hypothetical protein